MQAARPVSDEFSSGGEELAHLFLPLSFLSRF